MNTLKPLNITKIIGTAEPTIQQFLKDFREGNVFLHKPYRFKFNTSETKVRDGITYIKTEMLDNVNQYRFIGYMDYNAALLIAEKKPVSLQQRGGTTDKPTFGLKVFVYETPNVQTEQSIQPINNVNQNVRNTQNA